MKSNITLLKMSSGYRKNLRYFIFQDNKKVLCIMVTFVMFLFIVFPERKRIGPTLTVNSNINAMPSSVLNSTPNKIGQNPGSEIQSDMKYILLWTDAKASPFIYMGKGQSTFSNRKCKWTNCYVTDDRNYLGHYSEFEVIAFNGPQLVDALFINDLPTTRSSRQKYVYANIESAENYPINTFFFNGFFNWTWTYKLNSDALWGYFVVRNATKHSVAPSVDVHWKTLKEMEPIGDELKNKLNRKSIAVAGYITNCYTSNHREKYISALRKQMDRLNLQIDVYGKCGTLECPKKIMTRCLKYLENNYFFYLAFENSCSDDYVTEKVVSALQYSTVPIVYSGANYSRYYFDTFKHFTFVWVLEIDRDHSRPLATVLTHIFCFINIKLLLTWHFFFLV